jgi:hypothetical protein
MNDDDDAVVRTRVAVVGGMSAATAARIELSIILLCVLSLLFIFQPFSRGLFSAGCILVVVGGLAFNLIPLCESGRPARDLLRAAVIVVVVFLIVLALALLSAYLYGLYLKAQRAGG